MQKRRRPKPTPRGKEKPRRLWGPGLHFSRPPDAAGEKERVS
jgi:hypothetical protein